VQYKRRNG